MMVTVTLIIVIEIKNNTNQTALQALQCVFGMHQRAQRFYHTIKRHLHEATLVITVIHVMIMTLMIRVMKIRPPKEKNSDACDVWQQVQVSRTPIQSSPPLPFCCKANYMAGQVMAGQVFVIKVNQCFEDAYRKAPSTFTRVTNKTGNS
jgi:hypothetical protein